MAISTVDTSQLRTASIAGLAYLISFATVVFAQFAIHDRLFVVGNLAGTANNILAHFNLSRVGLVCDLASSAAILALTAAL